MKVFQLLLNFFADRTCEIRLPAEKIKEIVDRNGIGDWFFYAFTHRKERWHVCEPSRWILRNVTKSSRIFETGCGSGLNLIWLAQEGFSALYGSDISEGAIAAGRELSLLGGYSIEMWPDDALDPKRLPAAVDVVLGLNWTYHVPGFDLKSFLTMYRRILNLNGTVIVDVIDSSFNKVPNNEFLTSDWPKPAGERKPSEYKVRYSADEVTDIADSSGFSIVHQIWRDAVIPRVVYVFRRNG